MTTIGPNTLVKGRIEGSEDVTVHGRVEGDVVLSATLVVASGGFVQGDVRAQNVVIEGAVDGSIEAEELLHLAASAHVRARVVTAAFRMDGGANLSGDVEMDLDRAVPERTTSVPDLTRHTEPTRNISTETTRNVGTEKTRNVGTEKTRSLETETTRKVAVETVEPEGDDAEEEPAEMSEDELMEEYTVKELREMLRERDLQVSGTKDELVERLQESEG